MEIVGIGTNIVECLRIGRLIEKHGEQFLSRIYSEREIHFCQARKRPLEHFAGYWAAKEAILKCLGANGRSGVVWTDIEIRTEAGTGTPRVVLRGALKELAQQHNIGTVLLSTSHCRAYAMAYATAVCSRVPAQPGT
jgi:holo-[acyl-carrier protein] synthase